MDGKIGQLLPTGSSYGGNLLVVSGSFTDSLIYNGTSTTLRCKVVDSNSSFGLEGYNVSFYNQTGYIGSNTTDSNGWVILHYTDHTVNPPQTYNFTCNITNQSSIYYTASSDNYERFSLNVMDLTKILKSSGTTTVITEGISEEGGLLGDEALTEFVADAVIKLDFVPISERFRRTLTISKMRRTNHSTFVMPFEFTRQGLRLVEFGKEKV